MPTITLFDDTTIDTSTLSEATRTYLMQYGANQSVKDAIAGLAKSIGLTLAGGGGKNRMVRIAEWEKDAGMPAPVAMCDAAGDVVESEDLTAFIEAVEMARMRAKWQRIIDGTVEAAQRGPRRKGLDAIMAEVALEAVRKAPAITSGKVAWPTGKGSARIISGWVESYIAKNRAAVEAEAKRRLAAPAPDFDIELPGTNAA